MIFSCVFDLIKKYRRAWQDYDGGSVPRLKLTTKQLINLVDDVDKEVKLGQVVGLTETYYATKNYVLSLTRAIYKELKKNKSKVTISALCPGPIKTEFFDVANVKFLIGGVESKSVAKYAVDKALKGKLVILPGIVKFVPFWIRLVPTKFVMSVLYKFQSMRKG